MGVAAPAGHAGDGRYTHKRTPAWHLWTARDAFQANGPSTTTHTWAGWPLGMPVGARFLAWPTAPRTGNPVSMGHAHAAPPINTPGIYPRTRYQRLTGVPGRRLPTESKGSRPPYGREPGPPRNPRNFGCFFLFTHLSDMHRPATVRIPGRTPGPTLHGAGTCARPPRPRFSGPRTIIANLLVC